MTEIALKKILTQTVMKEFPEIEDILILGDFNDWDENHIKKYEIFFGITPENMSKITSKYKINSEDIREKIRHYSSYILNSKKEKIGSILLYNPNNRM